MSATLQAPAADQAAQCFPAYMLELLHRSAFLQQAHRLPPVPVPFVWLEPDGSPVHYLACWDWPFNADGPRAMVLRQSTAELVCASLPGRMWDIDPATVNTDTMGCDEMAHEVWLSQQQPRTAPRSRASGA